MKLADFNLPLITFVDTPGAYPGIESEERGMSEAKQESEHPIEFKNQNNCNYYG